MKTSQLAALPAAVLAISALGLTQAPAGTTAPLTIPSILARLSLLAARND